MGERTTNGTPKGVLIPQKNKQILGTNIRGKIFHKGGGYPTERDTP